MQHDEALAWIDAHVPRETRRALDQYVGLLERENLQQNLIARSTVNTIWARHIVDSAQLMHLAPAAERWIDIGSGAGLPGIVLALLGAPSMTLVEPRGLRVRFLQLAVNGLGLEGRVRIVASRIEALSPDRAADVITARAVAPLATLFGSAGHLAQPSTTWLLMKGRTAADELEAARISWQGDFELSPSITDPDAAIVIARNVRPRK